ncbi:ABC transporter substrate-binding protein [Cryobacterium sp. PH29-G1]|uniref:ABC transporter substrate-binding protein n=1 Tax=Cryobacterium sp. PH29-G1 TaxID=3046211 RepID=UPI0024B8BD1A|nr:ABC transporter substrate-binding protein [Cryobacterium sp. PH29-G1]MDJ0348310.1 ABC transporter substrate-binding protein [Cryobacterium sp. PH29-G1]
MFAPQSSPRIHRTSHRILRSSSVVIVAALSLSACSTPNSQPSDGASEFTLTAVTPAPTGNLDSFTWSVHAEPYSLDYAYAFDYPDNQVLANVCESLLRWNSDLTIAPGLAESFENPTPTTWVYTLRPGVKFHDGTPLTAADAVASMNRHLDPQVGSSWFSAYQNVASIEQSGDMQVTVTTTVPDSQFNQGLTGAPGVIESAATLAKDGKDYGNSSKGVNCTGPFTFGTWTSGESITLERFDGYWDKSLIAKSKQVKFVFQNDPNARVNAFKAGEVDGGWMVPSNGIDQLRSSAEGQIYFGTNTAVASMIVSNLAGPLGDVRVRQALTMAIDRDGLLKAAEQGYGTVTDAITAKSVWNGAATATVTAAFGDLKKYPYDLKAAKKLIEEAGVTGQEIVIATSPINAAFDVIAQATAAAASSIGLKSTIETITPNKWTTMYSDPAAREGIDLFYTLWYQSITDPLESLAILRTGEFSNYGNWSDPQFDQIVTDAVGISDPAERAAEAARAQVIVNEQLPWLPLYESPTVLWLGKKITGVAPSINFLYYPWAATIGAR